MKTVTWCVLIVVTCITGINGGSGHSKSHSNGGSGKSRGQQQRERLQRLQEKQEEMLSNMTSAETSVKNYWPINEAYVCRSIVTRDKRTWQQINQDAESVTNTPDCGVNMFEWARRQKATHFGRRHTRSTDSSSDLDKALDQLTDQELDDVIEILNQLEQTSSDVTSSKDQTKASDVPDAKTKVLRSWLNDVDRAKMADLVSPRIVGGTESQAGKNPWLAALGTKAGGLKCGATIITSRWLVTAAHCFDEKEKPCSYNVRMGSFNWYNDDSGHHQDVEPELIVVHPDFDKETLENDLALVRLSRDLTLEADGYINNACLPPANQELTVNEPSVAAGWGTINEGDSMVPQTVHEVSLPVLSRDLCHFPLTDDQMCAGSLDGGIDTCQGDSGGPLVANRDGHWYIIGVTSYGNGCGRPEWPGIYTYISSYTEYISSVINKYS